MPSPRVIEQARSFLLSNWASVLVLLILLTVVGFRIRAYGDLTSTVATMDTQSYMFHAQALRDPEAAFLGERLLTTGLLYRLLDASDCPLGAVSIPAIGREARRAIQPCFAGIAGTQTALSILGWGLLIAAFASRLQHAFAKVMAAVILSIFAFSPQLADWDSILSSESLSLSLGALALGLGMFAANGRVSERSGDANLVWTWAKGLTSLLAVILWMLVRDSHVYTGLIMGTVLLTNALVLRPLRPRRVAWAAVLVTSCLLIQVASHQSGRWRIPLTNAIEKYILPYPARIESLQALGMPAYGSPAYDAWFDRSAPGAYITFLGLHPGFVATTLADHLNILFAENNQPYFKTPGLVAREAALRLGDLVHVRSEAVLLIDLVLVVTLLLAAWRSRTFPFWPDALMMAALLASGAATLALTFFADAVGIERHVMLALVLFRLLLWLCILTLIDVALRAASAVSPA